MLLKDFANHNFNKMLAELSDGILMPEPWGKDHRILSKYINVNFEIAQAQDKVYEDKANGIAFWKVGYLVNQAANPLWFLYEKNNRSDRQYWNFKDYCYGNIPISLAGKTVDDFQVTYEEPKFRSAWQFDLTPDAVEHIMETNNERLVRVFGEKLAQNQHMLLRTILGELELQKKKSDVMPQWYHGGYQYLMPLYLTSPNTVDLTATLEPQENSNSYKVRTLLYPEYSYPCIRAVVKNRSALTGWMNISEETLNDTDLTNTD